MDAIDHRGLAVTGANAESLDHFEQALAELQCYRADPVASVDKAIAASPGFAMAHVLRAWLHLLGTEPAGIPVARESHQAAAATAGTPRERGHVEAIGHLIEGRWHRASRVLEMQNRTADGIAWMTANPDAWAGDSFFKVHNWWHLALYHFDRGEIDAVLKLFDTEIYGAKSGVVLDMIDASALLWRLHLRGVDVGARWDAVADNWSPIATAGNYAFNDAHAVMAFVGAGRREAAAAVIAAQKDAMARNDDNAMFTRDVGHDVCRAILAFGDGDYAAAVGLLRPIRSIAARFGGSHAQRDVLDLTLIEAAFRAGDTALAGALAAERLETRHESPLARLFVRRAGTLRVAA